MVVKQEKITFTLPSDLKAEVVKLKDELSVSLNYIYQQAITEYIKKQEMKKWEKGIKLASKNKEYLKLCEEIGNEGGELYEHD